MFKKKVIIGVVFLSCLFVKDFAVFAQVVKFPDYSYEFIGEDRWENFNRKIFNFNLKLNKYAIRPLHILWASVMPEYGMERLQSVTNNIEFPIRLVSCLIQKDFEGSKTETIRFFTNTILGLGGLYDPAKSILNIEPINENMEQALAGCNLHSGSYLVLPIISSTSLRGILGRILDLALNPGSYIATPVLAIIKAGLTVNKTSFLQPLIKMVESTYADPYDIARKIYGLETYMRCKNFDRIDLKLPINTVEPVKKEESAKVVNSQNSQVLPLPAKSDKIIQTLVTSEIVIPDLLKGGAKFDSLAENYGTENFKLDADIFLQGYNPQNPVIDSMRTALFNLPEVNKSMWNELSVWNRSFSNKIKTSAVNITEGREDYKFRYILQKEKNCPVAIIYPSIGEGIMSSHSVLLAKLFYDAGYSVIIQGSHFQWEFVKSMPVDFHPGLPSNDANALKLVTTKILTHLQDKYNCVFGEKLFIGTSFGALTSLFLADSEYKNNTLGKANFISICPPVDLIYAMKQIDKNTQEWDLAPNEIKDKVATTAAKILKVYEQKEDIVFPNEINGLPFSAEEAKLITGFVMHQKLSDLIFTLENTPKNQKTEIYNLINNMNYQDYAKKYLLTEKDKIVEDLVYETGLISISDFLANGNNYKIYHSLTDYLTNANQLKTLKQFSGKKLVLLDNGAHLGFLYRQEFLNDLKETIKTLKTSAVFQ